MDEIQKVLIKQGRKDLAQKYYEKVAGITARQVEEKLQTGDANPDEVSKKKDGTFIARWGYFYSHGQTAAGKAEKVKKAIPGVEIINSGDHFTAFKGGAPLKSQSHFYVIFKMPDEVKVTPEKNTPTEELMPLPTASKKTV